MENGDARRQFDAQSVGQTENSFTDENYEPKSLAAPIEMAN